LRDKDDSLRFEHHRILEYLAATYWESSAVAAVRRDQLANPWWREVLTLRAGITGEPNRLVKEICANFAAANNSASGQTEWTASLGLETLEVLAALELLLICAKQRWKELDQDLTSQISVIVDHLAKNGTTLERVRLARALEGFPIVFAAPVLLELLASHSDWLVSEVMASVDAHDYGSEEFFQLLVLFTKQLDSGELPSRLRILSRIPTAFLLRPQIRGAIALAALRVSLAWAAVVGFILVVRHYKLLDPDNLVTSVQHGFAWKLLLPIAVLLFWVVISAGVRVTLCVVGVPLLLSLVAPPRSMFHLAIVFGFYFAIIGREYRRAKMD
jgi:hypothetical protein